MRLLREQLDLPPVQELMQSGEWVLSDGTLIHVTPHLQPHQSHADVQSSVKLQIDTANTWVTPSPALQDLPQTRQSLKPDKMSRSKCFSISQSTRLLSQHNLPLMFY